MKKILGLDLGSSSIGWAFVHEAENQNENTNIIDAGVRVVPLTTDEMNSFNSGQTISTNADRRMKRSARRNLQRFKLRREILLQLLVKNGFIRSRHEVVETGVNSTYRNWLLRSKAATEPIELHEFATVLMMLNKKRGYKSSRKSKGAEEDGTAIDAVDLSLKLNHQGITPGQFMYQELKNSTRFIKPEFYASDLRLEIERILEVQKKYHEQIDSKFIEKFISYSSKAQCLSFLKKEAHIELVELPKNRNEKLEFYLKNRSMAVSEKVEIGTLSYVLTEIKGEIDKASGYLGAISDRSKILRVNGLTIGQYLFNKIKKNPLESLKNIIFYRQDYIDEFDQIWDTQSKHHAILNDTLKAEFRDIVIFYQRRLKSQKHLVADCEFAIQVKMTNPVKKDEKIPMKRKVAPKSSPMFQEFRLLQALSNLRVSEPNSKLSTPLNDEQFEKLYDWLQLKSELTASEIYKILNLPTDEFQINVKSLIGNRTRSAFLQAIQKIMVVSGHEEIDMGIKRKPAEIESDFKLFLNSCNINNELLSFDAYSLDIENQKYYKVWHLLYSAEENEHIREELMEWLNLEPMMLSAFYSIPLEDDFSNISTWAIKKLIPFMRKGKDLEEATVLHSEKYPHKAFKHSEYLNLEENENRELKDKLHLLKQGELRNPVVEKIVNQLVNLVNHIIADNSLGRPDEIRIEMARELKASNDERNSMSKMITKNQRRNEEIRDILKGSDFQAAMRGRVTANDILRYKLWIECGKVSIYTGKQIPVAALFNGEYDIEHIIPKSKYFDDSIANKALCERKINEEKGGETAYSYFKNKGGEVLEQYLKRVEHLYKIGLSGNSFEGIGKRKRDYLLMANEDIPNDFINRQLQETRYITRKASELLFEVTRKLSFTTGSVTKRLREDWGLVDVLKELNWEKYSQIEGRTEIIKGKNGEHLRRIVDWDKRNDHRHHAMDAITVALTKPAYVQLFNNLNAKNTNSNHFALKNKYLINGKLEIPFEGIRSRSLEVLGSIFISHKSKNKVTTPNVNRIQTAMGKMVVSANQSVPRGQLHKETVYGKTKQYECRHIKLSASTTLDEINSISNQIQKNAVLNRLAQFDGDIVKAFGGKNAVKKNPIYLDSENKYPLPEKIKITVFTDVYSIRKTVGPDLKLEKVVDVGVRRKLEQHRLKYGKDAFTNLTENPVWLNEEKGIAIKSVATSGVANATPLHFKRDHFGKLILDERGMRIPNDYVSLGNNHHVAIFRDHNENLQEEVVSFYEAVRRKNAGESVVRKDHPLGWEFIFTLKQNDMFVIPQPDFDPSEIDFQNPANLSLIGRNLYRVQKLASKDYWFRHQLETTVTNDIKNLTYVFIASTNRLKGFVKCRLNHLGKIVDWDIRD